MKLEDSLTTEMSTARTFMYTPKNKPHENKWEFLKRILLQNPIFVTAVMSHENWHEIETQMRNEHLEKEARAGKNLPISATGIDLALVYSHDFQYIILIEGERDDTR